MMGGEVAVNWQMNHSEILSILFALLTLLATAPCNDEKLHKSSAVPHPFLVTNICTKNSKHNSDETSEVMNDSEVTKECETQLPSLDVACMSDRKRESVKEKKQVMSRATMPSSSVWCHDSFVSGKRCYFQNLYYLPLENEYLFLMTPKSVVYGVGAGGLKDLASNLFLSSVLNHTGMLMSLVVVTHESVYEHSFQSLQGKYLMFSRFKPDNLMHVVHDDLMPLYFTLRELCGNLDQCSQEISLFIADDHDASDFIYLYKLLASQLLHAKDYRWDKKDTVDGICLEGVHVGLNKMSIWYQYGFGRPQGPVVNEVLNGFHIRSFARYIRNGLGLRDEYKDKVVGVLFSRKSTRKILNEDEVAGAMKNIISDLIDKELGGKNVEVIMMSLEEYQIKDIIQVVSGAKVLVGVHGAALILSVFLPPHSTLIELWPYGIDPHAASVYKALCNVPLFNVLYKVWLNKDFAKTKIHPEYPKHYGGLTSFSQEQQRKVLSSLRDGEPLGELECCDGADWLFRIYQDTWVSIEHEKELDGFPSFSAVLKDSLSLRDDKKAKFGENGNGYTTSKVTPSKVLNLECFIVSTLTGKQVQVKWQHPTNKASLPCSVLKFEVILDFEDENFFFFTSDTWFYGYPKASYNTLTVWVTALCNSDDGAPNMQYCTKVN